MSMQEKPLRAYVHGLRNQVAEFDGNEVNMWVGGMAAAGHTGGEATVLITVEGTAPNGKTIDVEIAVPHSQMNELIALLSERAGNAN